MRAVDEVLEEIGAGEKPRLLVLNKADLLDEEERRDAPLRHPDAVLVSAIDGEGLDALRERVEAAFEETLAEVELLVPYAAGRAPARAARARRRASSAPTARTGSWSSAKVPIDARDELHRFEGPGRRPSVSAEGASSPSRQ